MLKSTLDVSFSVVDELDGYDKIPSRKMRSADLNIREMYSPILQASYLLGLGQSIKVCLKYQRYKVVQYL